MCYDYAFQSRSRVECFLTDPAEQPDRKKWETEVAIRLADVKLASGPDSTCRGVPVR